jgi:RNA polymerase sigma-70 factor (ECF subfamily)
LNREQERGTDMKVFEEIYNDYKSDIYRFLYKLTSYQWELSEELLQETFYQAFLSFDRFRGECEIKTWMCQIAKNTYYRYVRNEIKNENLVMKISQEDHIYDVEEQIVKREIVQLIHRILDEFDERTKNIVLFRMYAEIKFSEIAMLLDIKEATAKVIYSRAKVKIQTILKERYEYEI